MKIIVNEHSNWYNNIEYLPGELKTILKGDKVQVHVLIEERTFPAVMKGDLASLQEFVTRSIYAYNHKLGLYK
jgi:hypothetical protein